MFSHDQRVRGNVFVQDSQAFLLKYSVESLGPKCPAFPCQKTWQRELLTICILSPLYLFVIFVINYISDLSFQESLPYDYRSYGSLYILSWRCFNFDNIL